MPDDAPQGFGLCDHPDRLAATIFRAVGTDCPCCAFWRGMTIGGLIGFLVAGLLLLARSYL